MGDRAVVGFRENESSPTIFLYSHWAGSSMNELLAIALEKSRVRWEDNSYATRIAISQIIGDDWNQELGWGLSVDNFSAPNRDYYLVVDWQSMSVIYYKSDWRDGSVREEFDRISLDNFCLTYLPSVAK